MDCRWLTFAVAAVAVGVIPIGSRAARAENYNEAFFPDLSSDPAMPDPIRIDHTTSDVFNRITGSVGDGDVDIITITVRPYHQIDSLILKSYSGPSQSFLGIENGGIWTAGLGVAVDPSSLLGWTHFGPAATGAGVGNDLLDDLATPKNGSAGFTPPLGPGVYTVLLQDTGVAVNYTIEFIASLHLLPAGDFNGDLAINGLDVTQWEHDFSLNVGSNADGDSDSDGADFLIWQQNQNRGDLFVSSAPEPSALALMSVALGIFSGLRRRRPA